jgi:hypothetical protein
MRAGRTEEQGSPASSLLTMRYNINLFFLSHVQLMSIRSHIIRFIQEVAVHDFFFSRMYSCSHAIWCGGALQERRGQGSNFRNEGLTGSADWNWTQSVGCECRERANQVPADARCNRLELARLVAQVVRLGK